MSGRQMVTICARKRWLYTPQLEDAFTWHDVAVRRVE